MKQESLSRFESKPHTCNTFSTCNVSSTLWDQAILYGIRSIHCDLQIMNSTESLSRILNVGRNAKSTEQAMHIGLRFKTKLKQRALTGRTFHGSWSSILPIYLRTEGYTSPVHKPLLALLLCQKQPENSYFVNLNMSNRRLSSIK